MPTDELSFDMDLHNFNFLMEYRIYRDRISFDCVPDNANPNRTIETYINLKEKYDELTCEISYSFNHPVISNMISLNYRKQFGMSMPFHNEILRFGKPMYYLQISGNVNILKNMRLDYSFFYNSTGNEDYLRYNKPYSSLSLTVAQYFMNRNLMISFSVADIFNKNKSNNWTQHHYGNIVYTQDSDPDTRYVVFRIRYNLGVNKNIQRKMSDTDHIERL
jgi:hypothetical protein